jgi:hypothetical protein
MGWTDQARVLRALGPQALPDPYIDDCVASANAWAPRKRAQAGYTGPDGGPEDPVVAPSEDVALGTTLYAVALYNERASTDSHASFTDLAGFTPTGTMGQINRLLGVGRGAVDLPPPVEPAPARRADIR